MTVDIPTEMKVITRGIKQNDTLFTEGTFDYIQTMSEIREENIYLLGKNFEKNYDLEIIMTEDEGSIEYGDFKKLSAKSQEELLNLLSEKEDTVACSIYSTDSAIYFESLLKHFVDGRACFSKEYYTVVDGKNISIRLNSYDDQLTDAEYSELKSIVDSIVYDKTVNWSFAESLTGTVICVIVLILGFISIAVIKTKEIILVKNSIIGIIPNPNNSNNASDNVNVSEEDEEESRMILDFLSTDKELEERSNIEEKQNNNNEDDKNNEKEEDHESIDISVEGIITNVAEDDEEFNFLTDNEFEFSDDDVESDETLDKPLSNDVTEKADINDSEEKAYEECSENITDIREEQQIDEASVEQNNTEGNVTEEVDLAAAIAYFEEDFETRKKRREEFRARNQAKKSKGFFCGLKKKL